jgi:hypothetical protein
VASFKKGEAPRSDPSPSFLSTPHPPPCRLAFLERETTRRSGELERERQAPPPAARGEDSVCEDGEAGAGEEVAHQHGGPADLARGGAARPGARGHAAAQPPVTPGEPAPAPPPGPLRS